MVYERHGEEIKLYQLVAGTEKGKLLFAVAILSDVQHLLDPSMITNVAKDEIRTELDEAKQLIGDVMREVREQQLPAPDEAPMTWCPHCGAEYNVTEPTWDYVVAHDDIQSPIYRHKCGGLVVFRSCADDPDEPIDVPTYDWLQGC